MQERVKRAFDFAASLLGLILLAPVLALVAIMVKMSSPGPVIFTQERIGRYGKPFQILKIRTMVEDAEAATGPVLAQGEVDPRLTKIGRFLRSCRLDEIPQLWNVLKGEMSLVGPRPERPHFVRKFVDRTPAYAKRHEVRPGITGLAQVSGGYHTDARDKLRFDLIYVSHQSLWLDLEILARTVKVCVVPRR
jgi:exopolysaccharide biosynthesis polyprenyl glycosylphosphotransferase